VEGPVAGGAAADAVDGRVDEAQVVALARKLRPDVCLVDIRMPGLDGIEVTRALAGPGIADPLRVVIVTTFDTDEYVYGALRAGAAGFLLKDAGPALLLSTVKTHITRIHDKLGIRNRVELAAWSWENRIMGSSP
jgi:DNA-binding NarL/FixJ family response regulator